MNSTFTINKDYWISFKSEKESISRQPLFVIANRFRVHPLRIAENYSGYIVKAYLIVRTEPVEKLIVCFLFCKNGELQKKMILLKKGFDRELGSLLSLTLIDRLGQLSPERNSYLNPFKLHEKRNH